ncbi:MAG: hypothetical protein BWX88_05177 [Planctomycetes bacterium ADurb.Bin126]|nr:MAG: hypothetical protein BWX88_05177 [Planctomycetes bacterium ADurb.Bin126]HOD84833.1 hypothetical protein [Phycisphaerae bacterium]HQL76382.1 hypothetical protein [Phycisphaerae bacterium]
MDTPKHPEQEAIVTTIVGGRPPGCGTSVGQIPRGIEVLVKKAAVDPEFRTLLLERRAQAAAEIQLELTPAEAMMLTAVPAAQLEAIIDSTEVPDETRRTFLGKAAAAMLAALGAGPIAAQAADAITKGDRPDPVPTSRGVRPDGPPAPTGIRPDPPVSKGVRPDVPPTQPAAPRLVCTVGNVPPRAAAGGTFAATILISNPAHRQPVKLATWTIDKDKGIATGTLVRVQARTNVQPIQNVYGARAVPDGQPWPAMTPGDRRIDNVLVVQAAFDDKAQVLKALARPGDAVEPILLDQDEIRSGAMIRLPVQMRMPKQAVFQVEFRAVVETFAVVRDGKARQALDLPALARQAVHVEGPPAAVLAVMDRPDLRPTRGVRPDIVQPVDGIRPDRPPNPQTPLGGSRPDYPGTPRGGSRPDVPPGAGQGG